MTRSLPAVLALLAATAVFLPAQDDRDRTTPTGAIWSPDQSTAELSSLTSAGWRFTDLEIESTSPWEFTVAAVSNTGTYAKSWWYAIGVTGAQLSSTLSTNNARLVDLEPYDDNGTTRFVAIMVSNTGADAKAWWWGYDMTSTQVNSAVTTNNARLTSFSRYTIGGQTRWAVAMISNTGADQKPWGYLYGASGATIGQNISQNNNRIYGIERVGTDSYDVILVQNTAFAHWYYFDLTGNELTELLQQNIGRIVDVERHPVLLSQRYNVAMIDNANTLERTARSAFLGAAAGGLGDYGFFLKEVDGPVLAQMRPDTVFEPASTMKTLYHVHAMRRVALNQIQLGTLINKPLSCGVPGNNQTLELTLSEMMEVSDNYSTLAISNHFGIPNINNTAAALGMSSTSVNFTIGCTGPAPENQLTLRDLSTLHEQVAGGYLGGQRAKFYELMAESLSFPSWGNVDLDGRINAHAVALGLPTAVRNAFKNELHIAYKPGGIGWAPGGVNTYYFAEGGWMSVPFKNGSGALVPREYTFGVFNYLFHAQEISGRNAMSQAELEIVWDRVKAAMATWDNHVPGQLTPLVGAGCAGSNGVPLHTATGTPDVGSSVDYRLASAPSQAICAALFAFDNVAWNGIPLPFDLGVVGAPGCNLRVNFVLVEARLASLIGTATVTLPFPNSPAFIGAQLYTQYMVFDPPANAFGWTLTSAIRTTVGGWL